MRTRDRHDDDAVHPGSGSPVAGSGGSGRARLRGETDDMMGVAASTIDKSLSGDSVRYNRAAKQQSGQ